MPASLSSSCISNDRVRVELVHTHAALWCHSCVISLMKFSPALVNIASTRWTITAPGNKSLLHTLASIIIYTVHGCMMLYIPT